MKAPGLSLLLFACVLFVVGIGSCGALDCYTCSPDRTGSCDDPFDPASATITRCPSGNACMAKKVHGAGEDFYTRGCIEADSCRPTGCIKTRDGNVCDYCCNENLCNSESIADAVEDILQCYICAYRSANPMIGTPACNDPLDPNAYMVSQVPCGHGQCGVGISHYMGVTTVIRECFANSTDYPGMCIPGCYLTTCRTCCSDSLCNGGPAAGVPTMPGDAPWPSTMPGDAPWPSTMPGDAPSTMSSDGPSKKPGDATATMPGDERSTTERSAAPPTTAGGKASLATILLVSVGLPVVLL